MAGGGAVDRLDRVAVLADPAFGRDLGGEPVLSGAGGDRGHGLCAVRRAARPSRDSGHGGLRRRGVFGQSARASLTRLRPKQEPPDLRLKALANANEAGSPYPQMWIPGFAIRLRANYRVQRFDFLAFFFFLVVFFEAFLAAFLADFFADFF